MADGIDEGESTPTYHYKSITDHYKKYITKIQIIQKSLVRFVCCELQSLISNYNVRN